MVAVIDRQGRGSIARLGSSPDGARILVGRTYEDGAPGSSGSLWSANTDGSAARMLVAGTNVGLWLTEWRPTWADH
jgi:hypothetical protein